MTYRSISLACLLLVACADDTESIGVGESVFIACLPDDDGCSDGDAERCASESARGPLYRFPTQCIPPGWTDRGAECDR